MSQTIGYTKLDRNKERQQILAKEND